MPAISVGQLVHAYRLRVVVPDPGDCGRRHPAQIAFASLPAQKPSMVPIPGTTKRNRLKDNIGALSVELTSDDLRDIDEAASKITVQGGTGCF
jgi:aryl-alcohol dehydrogenase-like predicted oxidoreductase